MLCCLEFCQILAAQGFTFASGVPDSTFKEFLSCLDELDGREFTNRRAAIERDAIGYAAGYYLATGRPALVYLQNSGLGNIVNPLTSLADAQVSQIPILLMIGWRGEPGGRDEPQHRKMGEIMLPLLELLGIRYGVLPFGPEEAALAIVTAREHLRESGECYALIVRDHTFLPYQPVRNSAPEKASLTREAAIQLIAKRLNGQALVIATTGKISRELFAYRAATGQSHAADFLVVGAMGLASSIGAEVALQHPREKVFIFDGDGAVLMSAGGLAVIGATAPKNLYHVIFDNGSYDSTGGQAMVAQAVAWEHLACANAYQQVAVVDGAESLHVELSRCLGKPGPCMLVVKVKKGSSPDLARPGISPFENRRAFMQRLEVGS